MVARRLVQERRIRAIAAVHFLAGAAVVAGAVVWLVVSAKQVHGPNDLGAAGIPFIAGAEIAGGAIFMGIAYLLWKYHAIAKWTTAVLFAGASVVCIYTFVRYSTDEIGREAGAWRHGLDSNLSHYIRGGLVECLLVVWSIVVLAALLRPDSREVFSTRYRKLIRTDPATRIQFHSSPYFVTGLIVWLAIGWAICV